MARDIRRAAVLGAGVMGSGIAAHLANAQIPTYLLDIVPKELTEEETRKGLTLESKEVRNRFAMKGLTNAVSSKPAAFFSKKNAELVTAGNFEDDMERLKECDLIIEAVVEILSIKQQIFKRLAKFRSPGTIVASSTSGISVS
jgi:3-hydroxyacyl-CoA dehydrogenase